MAFSAKEASDRALRGEKVILVRLETSPEDIEGMAMAQGILTARGGMTSHTRSRQRYGVSAVFQAVQKSLLMKKLKL